MGSSVSSGVLFLLPLLPECCPFSKFLGAHRGPGRYCLIRVSLFHTRASHGIVASPLLHIPASFHNWISTDHSAGFKGSFLVFFFLIVRVVGGLLCRFFFLLSREKTLHSVVPTRTCSRNTWIKEKSVCMMVQSLCWTDPPTLTIVRHHVSTVLA